MARPVNDADDDQGRLGSDRVSELFGDPDTDSNVDHGEVLSEPAPGSRGRHAAPRSGSRRTPGQGRGVARRILEVVVIVVVALSIFTAVRVYIAQPGYVPNVAMESTLQPGDRVLTASLATRMGGVRRGEVVQFQAPVAWGYPQDQVQTPTEMALAGLRWLGLAPQDSSGVQILRVIGVGQDRVVCCDDDNRMVLNGVPLQEPYLKAGTSTDQVYFDVVVPENSVFLLGDNRAQSQDSRFHLDIENGAVPVGNVQGRVAFVLWPLSGFGAVPIPTTFDTFISTTDLSTTDVNSAP
jgi:signal peptidase I